MKTDQAEHDLARLRAEISTHNQKYYVEHNPTISDYEYDQLVKQAESLAKELGYDTNDKPIEKKVGDDRTKGFRKIKHVTPMLSIENTYEISELRSKLTKMAMQSDIEVVYIAEPKIDGIAVVLHYYQGELKYALTRGDGHEGDDVTINVKTIQGIPHNIPYMERVEIRGELYMDKALFKSFNDQIKATGEPGFANERNACAGSVKLHDVNEVAKRPLRFIGYRLNKQPPYPTHVEQLRVLKEWNFPVVEPRAVGSLDKVITAVYRFSNKNDLPYCTDGMVVLVNDQAICDSLGSTTKYPRWTLAYKYEPDRAKTRFIAIDATVGRTGVITPTAILEPTVLSGSIVSRASLHNYSQIAEKGLKYGDMVDVHKAAEIIPQIAHIYVEERTGEERGIRPPRKCPSCKEPLAYEEPILRCCNPHCPAQQLERIVYFASKPCMNIMDLGPTLISELINHEVIKNVADLYAITESVLVDIGVGQKRAANLINSIAESRSQPAERVLTALGIPLVGNVAAISILETVSDIRVLMDTKVDTLARINGVGPTTATNVVEFFQDPYNRDLVNRLNGYGLWMVYKPTYSENMKTCVITGRVIGRSRSDIAKQLLKRNVKTVDRITSSVDFLLLGDNAVESSDKYKKAKELGIPVYRMSEYLAS